MPALCGAIGSWLISVVWNDKQTPGYHLQNPHKYRRGATKIPSFRLKSLDVLEIFGTHFVSKAMLDIYAHILIFVYVQ